jgi:hypothetical protein
MRLGWLNPSTTWSKFEADANSKQSTQKVTKQMPGLDHGAEVLIVRVRWMISASHGNVPEQSQSALLSFLRIPVSFANDFLFLMGSYGLLRVTIRYINGACFSRLPPAQGGKWVRTGGSISRTLQR